MRRRRCNPREIALKSFFLGPQAENAPWVSGLIQETFAHWASWRKSLFPRDGIAISAKDQATPEFLRRRERTERTARELLARFEAEVPKFSPRYVGHMFSEISLPALLGHIVTLLHNPNNISGESSRVGIRIEDEAIKALLRMVGFSPARSMGHFTSGGTVANFEAIARARARCALWLSAGAASRAGNGTGRAFDPVAACHSGWKRFERTLRAPDSAARGGPALPSPVLLVPENMHYSWKNGGFVLGLGSDALWPIPLDARGKLSPRKLLLLLEKARSGGRAVLQVVSVVGTTELGGIDPVHEAQRVLDRWREAEGLHVWHHVDGAYGGFFRTLDRKRSRTLSAESFRALEAIPRVNSVTLDPHKLGYVPYASGTFLARDPRDYRFCSSGEVPYIDFDDSSDRGPYTIEGSRSAAGAVATWMTAKTMGLHPDGYGLLLGRTVRIRKKLEGRMRRARLPLQIAPGGDTNIICFACGKSGEALSRVNRRTLRIFERFSPQHGGPFIVSKTSLHRSSYSAYLEKWTSRWAGARDAEELVLIRMCLMNPFFESAETRADYSEEFIRCLRRALRNA